MGPRDLASVCGPALLAFVGCHGGGSSSPEPYAPPPASTVLQDPGPVAIRREIILVPGVVPPPNPVANAATPAAQNVVRIVRYRVDSDPPQPARAIVVMMPGFLGGAGSVDGIARAVVRRSADGDALEAWALDRRSNLLEDTWGEDVAEVRRDPSRARAYYFDGDTVEGQSFGGFTSGSQVPWASEWGLATTVGDLHNALALVPADARPQRVVLLGHSLGASIVEEYAAWDFGGAPGYGDLAGLVLVDGVAGHEGEAQPPVTQDVYEHGGGMAPGGVGQSLGLVSDLRQGNTLFTLPLLGVKVYAAAEYLAMAAGWTPTAVEADTERDSLLSILLATPTVPPMTDRAAFGFAFNRDSAALSFVAISCGEPTGGPVGPVTSALGATIQAPTDPTATYGWIDYDQSTPRGNTSIDDFARAWYEGPQLNFGEWYFPQRLALDPPVAGTLVLTDADWPVSAYGLAAKNGRSIDVPILAAACALEGSVDVFAKLAATVKTDASRFTTRGQPQLTHLDCVGGTDDKGSDVAAWYDAVVEFVRTATPTGGVVVPVQ